MPLFCELDQVMVSLQHGVLYRESTIAAAESIVIITLSVIKKKFKCR